ncbi:MAG: efflux RND transporter periplasmic adaptor subunit [Planctomycetota bacterium]|nr:efflux RND transporter periplasmic adaptor subunit [Planctomycetota bacterium]
MRLISSLVFSVAASGLALLLTGCGQTPSQAAPGDPAKVPAVKVVSPKTVDLVRTTTQPATIHAYHRAEIHARVAGYLKSLNVDIGKAVTENTELGVIGVPDLDKAREKQQANIRRLLAEETRAAAMVKLAKADVLSAHANQAKADADVATTVARINAATSELMRVQDLVKSKSVAERLLDEAREKHESAKAAKDSAIAAQSAAAAAVTVAKEREAVAVADELAAQAQTDVARKALEEMDVMLNFATLRSPFAGIVTQRNVDPGDLVRNIQASSEAPRLPLFEISQVDMVRVRIEVPEHDAPWVNEGDAVSLKLRSLPDPPIKGKVKRVAKQINLVSRTMSVEMEIDNTEGLLLPGMYGEATITLTTTPGARVLPATAVRFDEAGHGYLLLADNGKVVRVDVETGHDDGREIQVIGLTGNEQVIETMSRRLKPEQRVAIFD